MRYKIVTDRKPLPPRPRLGARPSLVEVDRRPIPVRPRMFAPLSWPGTSRDVEWSSTPLVSRAPAGWGGQGFTR